MRELFNMLPSGPNWPFSDTQDKIVYICRIMAVRTDSPQIVALIKAVEKRFGHPIDGRSDFSMLALDIEAVTHEHIAENTLRRLWGKIKGYDTVFSRTLDVLCQYIGYKHWAAFCAVLSRQSAKESEIVSDGVTIKADELCVGDQVKIGWLPDRICVVEYVGGRMFRAIDAKNSTLQVGDTFECSVMIKHYPLFVDNLVHGGEHCSRYSMGLNNGLTTLEKL